MRPHSLQTSLPWRLIILEVCLDDRWRKRRRNTRGQAEITKGHRETGRRSGNKVQSSSSGSRAAFTLMSSNISLTSANILPSSGAPNDMATRWLMCRIIQWRSAFCASLCGTFLTIHGHVRWCYRKRNQMLRVVCDERSEVRNTRSSPWRWFNSRGQHSISDEQDHVFPFTLLLVHKLDLSK